MALLAAPMLLLLGISPLPELASALTLTTEEKNHLFEMASLKGEEHVEGLLKALESAPDDTRSELANIQTVTGGESLLHLACIWGNTQKIKALLAAGADPNARSSKLTSGLDMTPLTWCCYAGYVDAVKEFLKDTRTDVNLVVRNEEGGHITALDIAYNIGKIGEPLVELLKNHDAHTFDDLKAMSFGGEEIPGMPPDRR